MSEEGRRVSGNYRDADRLLLDRSSNELRDAPDGLSKAQSYMSNATSGLPIESSGEDATTAWPKAATMIGIDQNAHYPKELPKSESPYKIMQSSGSSVAIGSQGAHNESRIVNSNERTLCGSMNESNAQPELEMNQVNVYGGCERQASLSRLGFIHKSSEPTVSIEILTQASTTMFQFDASHVGWGDQHLVLGPTDEELLEVCSMFGQGSLGMVEAVRLKDEQLSSFVRKRVKLPIRDRQKILKIVQDEAENLRALNHPHIVTLIGTYEEQKYNNRHFYCLLMSPVGENEPREFLERDSEQEHALEKKRVWGDWIRRWFVCLASALEYMHSQGIRHQDIKPSNIIHRGSSVFFTNSSSSNTFAVGHTTSTDKPCRSSSMYAAPE